MIIIKVYKTVPANFRFHFGIEILVLIKSLNPSNLLKNLILIIKPELNQFGFSLKRFHVRKKGSKGKNAEIYFDTKIIQHMKF